jgi:hypothetical protein
VTDTRPAPTILPAFAIWGDEHSTTTAQVTPIRCSRAPTASPPHITETDPSPRWGSRSDIVQR